MVPKRLHYQRRVWLDLEGFIQHLHGSIAVLQIPVLHEPDRIHSSHVLTGAEAVYRAMNGCQSGLPKTTSSVLQVIRTLCKLRALPEGVSEMPPYGAEGSTILGGPERVGFAGHGFFQLAHIRTQHLGLFAMFKFV